MEFDARNTSSFQSLKYENLKDGKMNVFSPLFTRLSIPIDARASTHILESSLQGVDPYEGPLQSDTMTLAWHLGYKLSNNNTKSFLYDANAIQGVLTWVQKGDKLKPTLVLLHALYGTPAGLPLKKHMPPDMPIIAIQAPELVREISITSTSERVTFYRNLLISELANYNNPHIQIMGYSLGGYLAYELARSLEGTKLVCGSLCLVDPPPLCPSSMVRPKRSYLMRRARTYDTIFKGLLGKDTSFTEAVLLNDITCVGDLEKHVAQCTSESSAHEVSCIVDTTM